jgi:hypothetical protein
MINIEGYTSTVKYILSGNELSSEKSAGLDNSGENDRFNSSGLNSTHETDRNGNNLSSAHTAGAKRGELKGPAIGIPERPVPNDQSHPIPAHSVEPPSNAQPQPVHTPDPAPAPIPPNNPGGEPQQPANTHPADGGSPPTNTHQEGGGPAANTNQAGGGSPPANTNQANGGVPAASAKTNPAFKQEDVGIKASGVKTKAASKPSSGGGSHASNPLDAFMKMSCFAGETQVRTPSGYKSIEELEVGDMVSRKFGVHSTNFFKGTCTS